MELIEWTSLLQFHYSTTNATNIKRQREFFQSNLLSSSDLSAICFISLSIVSNKWTATIDEQSTFKKCTYSSLILGCYFQSSLRNTYIPFFLNYRRGKKIDCSVIDNLDHCIISILIISLLWMSEARNEADTIHLSTATMMKMEVPEVIRVHSQRVWLLFGNGDTFSRDPTKTFLICLGGHST